MVVDNETYRRAHQDLLAAIGRALGLTGPFPETPYNGDSPASTAEPNMRIRVLGGAVDAEGDRVGWVERHFFADDGDGWVQVWLNLAGEGVSGLPAIQGWLHAAPPLPRVSVPLVDDRDDKVTDVWLARFCGGLISNEALVIGYGWAGSRHRLCRLTLGAPGLHGVVATSVDLGSTAAVVVDGAWFGDPDTVWHLDQTFDDGDLLMHGLTVPDLVPEVPIPVPRLSTGVRYVRAELRPGPDRGQVRWVERLTNQGSAPQWRDGREFLLRLPDEDQRGFPDDPESVWRSLTAALADGPQPPPDGPDILIGSLARPFWEPTSPVSSRGDVARLTRGPWWFPAAWYHYLRTPEDSGGAGRLDDAAVWLAWLDQLAADDGTAGDNPTIHSGWEPDWSREDGIVSHALVHLRRQAGVLASACRAAAVPAIGDLTGSPTARWPIGPPGFARAWRTLPEPFRSRRLPAGRRPPAHQRARRRR